MKYLDIDEVAEILCLSPATIKRKINANSDAIPPRMYLPGTRMLRCREHEVRNWMEETGWTRSTNK
jgi:predicted DNA-binding transcriptional regulator AlpA